MATDEEDGEYTPLYNSRSRSRGESSERRSPRKWGGSDTESDSSASDTDDNSESSSDDDSIDASGIFENRHKLRKKRSRTSHSDSESDSETGSDDFDSDSEEEMMMKKFHEQVSERAALKMSMPGLGS